MKKYNNTKTAVSNKSGILVYVVTALMISTAAIYFIAASQGYSDLVPSSSGNGTESKDSGDTIATVNEIIFFIVVGIAYIAAGIWMLENKYYSKVPTYSAAYRFGSTHCILHINKNCKYSFYRNTRRYRYNRHTFKGDASSYSWYINIHCQIVNYNMEKCNNKNIIAIIITSRNTRI